MILNSSHLRGEKGASKLAAIAVVAAGYGGDMDEELCNELLDDMDFHYNKVKCRKIEGMLPKLMKMVEGEMVSSFAYHWGQAPLIGYRPQGENW